MQEYQPKAPERYDRDQIAAVLEKLIDRCRDGEQGYADAAQHVSNPEMRRRFLVLSQERGRFAAELEAELERQGRWQTTRRGSVGGTLEQVWFDVKRALGGGDTAILESLLTGEDHAREAYQAALEEALPEQTAGLIRTQAQAIYGGQHYIRLLRDRYKAA